MYSRDDRFYAHSSVIMISISLVSSQLGNKQQNNPLVSAETVRHESAYIGFYLLNERRYRTVTILIFDIWYAHHNGYTRQIWYT